jgi:acyl-CoA synthetase (AMP-forming)/AMP-acid ligase II
LGVADVGLVPETGGVPMEITAPAALFAVAAVAPDRVCLVHRDVRYSLADLVGRVSRAARVFSEAGAGFEQQRASLQGWESGQGHVALMLRNGPEYLEAMLGAFVSRAVSFNVNFRYTADEFAEVLADARPRVVVVHDEFSEVAGEAIARVGGVGLVLQVPDGTGRPLLPGAMRWSDALGAAADDPPRTDWSPDDLYMLYTGGTTGKPKGVLWRQADALVAAFNIVSRDGRPFDSVGELAAEAAGRAHQRIVLAAPPLIHGASQWFALGALLQGGRVVFPDDVSRLDADSIFAAIDRESVTELLLVGDAFARPLVEGLESSSRQLPSLRAVVNGGAALSRSVRDRLFDALPDVRVIDSIGSSESGRQAARQFRGKGSEAEMEPLDGNVVLSADRSRVLRPDDAEIGWLARRGRVPLGYLHDEARTVRTFPVVDGVRYVVPGDRARVLADGTIEVLGRDATTINTGGEKVFGEEVEAALATHPAVREALVLGRSSPRWGQEVVALVAVDATVSEAELTAHVVRRLARYKVPKEVIFVAAIPRTPAAKPDYRAAQALLAAGRAPEPTSA